MQISVRDVWEDKYREELCLFDLALAKNNRVIVVDTEYPGFLVETDYADTAAITYAKLKQNVDRTQLIQLGLTVASDDGVPVACWNFNFKFDMRKNAHTKSSIAFLQSHGMDFNKLYQKGIEFGAFALMFRAVIDKHTNLLWVTFHGLYDMAYVMKLLTRQPLPDSDVGFAKCAAIKFGSIIDLKHVATSYSGLRRGKLGLEKLAEIVRAERIGGAHQAGSDSLLTASVFARMKATHVIQEDTHGGFLFGFNHIISGRLGVTSPMFVPASFTSPMFVPQPEYVLYRISDVGFGHYVSVDDYCSYAIPVVYDIVYASK